MGFFDIFKKKSNKQSSNGVVSGDSQVPGSETPATTQFPPQSPEVPTESSSSNATDLDGPSNVQETPPVTNISDVTPADPVNSPITTPVGASDSTSGLNEDSSDDAEKATSSEAVSFSPPSTSSEETSDSATSMSGVSQIAEDKDETPTADETSVDSSPTTSPSEVSDNPVTTLPQTESASEAPNEEITESSTGPTVDADSSASSDDTTTPAS